jgi:predicted ATPase/DNA-binding CsgD family transcriptional regulator
MARVDTYVSGQDDGGARSAEELPMAEPHRTVLNRPRSASLASLPSRERFSAPLPVPLTSFVGREREIAAVLGLLDQTDVRLVSLIGPGGIGKTRLALQVSDRFGAELADGVAFVSLASLDHTDLVGPTIAQALGIRETGDRPILERLSLVLAGRELLLVLDNFEQVTGAAHFLSDLLKVLPGLKLLVTSTIPLNISGEHRVPVSPMRVPTDDAATLDAVAGVDGVELFLARARAVRPDFSLDESNANDVAAVVRRLDGLPLAIELASARILVLTPATLLARLESRLSLLTGGPSDAPDRQRTLRNALSWSHDLLSGDERTVFRRLAVFVGGFTLEAAEAVTGESCSGRVGVLDTVASLVSQGLVHQTTDGHDHPRYALLETIREFGLEQLAQSGEDGAVRNRHADYFAQLAERADWAIFGGPNHQIWVDRLESDLANFRAAGDWCTRAGLKSTYMRLGAALGGLWIFRSYRVEGREWLKRALEHDDGTAPSARAMALVKLGLLEFSLGGDRAAELVAEGVTIRRRLGDTRGVGRALIAQGMICAEQKEFDRATTLIGEAAELLEQTGDLTGQAKTSVAFGMIMIGKGDPVRARAHLEHAYALFQQDVYEIGEAEMLLMIGKMDAEAGLTEAAARKYLDALLKIERLRSRARLLDGLVEVGHLALALGRASEATRLLGAASVLGETIGYLVPLRRAEYLSDLECARNTLGHGLFKQHWNDGRTCSPEAAQSEAIALLSNGLAASPLATESRTDFASLTPREHEVLRLLVEGNSDREIADALGISYRTVTSYVRNILSKLDVSSRTAAATQAVRRSIV